MTVVGYRENGSFLPEARQRYPGPPNGTTRSDHGSESPSSPLSTRPARAWECVPGQAASPANASDIFDDRRRQEDKRGQIDQPTPSIANTSDGLADGDFTDPGKKHGRSNEDHAGKSEPGQAHDKSQKPATKGEMNRKKRKADSKRREPGKHQRIDVTTCRQYAPRRKHHDPRKHQNSECASCRRPQTAINELRRDHDQHPPRLRLDLFHPGHNVPTEQASRQTRKEQCGLVCWPAAERKPPHKAKGADLPVRPPSPQFTTAFNGGFTPTAVPFTVSTPASDDTAIVSPSLMPPSSSMRASGSCSSFWITRFSGRAP